MYMLLWLNGYSIPLVRERLWVQFPLEANSLHAPIVACNGLYLCGSPDKYKRQQKRI